MVTKPKNWFNRYQINELASCKCPRCDTSYKFGPVFDHDIRWCSHCGAVLVEWNMNNHLYIIDKEMATPLVKAIIEYLAPLDEYQAFHELNELLSFLGQE